MRVRLPLPYRATELKVSMVQAIQNVFSVNSKENDSREYMGKAREAV